MSDPAIAQGPDKHRNAKQHDAKRLRVKATRREQVLLENTQGEFLQHFVFARVLDRVEEIDHNALNGRCCRSIHGFQNALCSRKGEQQSRKLSQCYNAREQRNQRHSNAQASMPKAQRTQAPQPRKHNNCHTDARSTLDPVPKGALI